MERVPPAGRQNRESASKRVPRHLITETRDWAKIVLAGGTAIAAIITAIGQALDRLG